MPTHIAYINFYRSFYNSLSDFEKQQKNILAYKAHLAKKNKISYLFNSNLYLTKKFKSITILSKSLNHFLFLWLVIKYIRKHNVSFVIIHGLDYFIEGAFIRIFTCSKVIIQHHAEKTHLRKKALLMPLADKRINAYLFNGKGNAEAFIQNRCISSMDKIHEVVEAGSNFRLLTNKKADPVKQLVFIGRLDENKNLLTLLKAIAVLKLKRTDFTLSIYYKTSELEKELKHYCEQNKLNGLVMFKGSVPQTEMETILNRSDIFVSCSFYEGSGYSLIEAIACGTFPVVSRIPAFDFLLEGLNEKEQFDPKNEVELADKLNKVLSLDFTNTRRKVIRNHFEHTCSDRAIASQIEKVLGTLS